MSLLSRQLNIYGHSDVMMGIMVANEKHGKKLVLYLKH